MSYAMLSLDIGLARQKKYNAIFILKYLGR